MKQKKNNNIMKQKNNNNNRFSSEMLEIMTGLHKAGCVDELTTREFEGIHFTKPKEFTAEEIVELRKRETIVC